MRAPIVSTVSALSAAIEAKDGVTSDHIHRVQAYAMGLARALDVTDSQEIQAIEAAALLHDTGKLAIPEHILNKPGRLTPAEFETMKSHVTVGADILSAIDFPYPVVPIVRAHHENWDGTGYPNGLRGEDIPRSIETFVLPCRMFRINAWSCGCESGTAPLAG
jgi:putative nucleotidyltransferase with HDIG domain